MTEQMDQGSAPAPRQFPPKRFLPAGEVDDDLEFVFPKRRNVARPKETPAPATTKTSNKFAALPVAEPKEKRKRHPPINIRSKVTLSDLRKLLANAGVQDYTVSPGPQETRLFLGPNEDQDAILELLFKNDMRFYTYARKGSALKRNKYRVFGVDETQNIEEVSQELKDRLKGFVSAHRLQKTQEDGSRTVTQVILVVTEASTKEEDVRALQHINHVRIKVSKFRTDGGPVQCNNCQELGHTQGYCWLYATCVRCGVKHAEKNCPTPQGPPKCRNCGREHVASWRGCPARLALIRKPKTVVPPPTKWIPAPQPTTSAWNTQNAAPVLREEEFPPLPGSTSAPQPQWSTSAPQPQWSTSAPQPQRSTSAPQPQSSTSTAPPSGIDALLAELRAERQQRKAETEERKAEAEERKAEMKELRDMLMTLIQSVVTLMSKQHGSV